jgi:hypothetical protein
VIVRGDGNPCADPAADNFNRAAAPGLAVGGWCQAGYGNICPWDHKTASIVLAGGFQADCRVLPNIKPWKGQGPQQVYLVLGGFLVGAEQDWNECAASYKMEIIEHIQKMRAIGIAYDLEGWLENIPVETLRAFTAELRSWLPDLKVVITPLDRPGDFPYETYRDWVDFISPMMYGARTTYQVDDPVANLRYSVPKWVNDAGWPAEKVYLTYQTDSAAGVDTGDPRPEVVRFLAQQVKENHYAGLLGWPSAPVGKDQDPTCPSGFGATTNPSDHGCCQADCADECTQEQEDEHKATCEARGWTWNGRQAPEPFTCCRCSAPCSSDPVESTTREIQAVAVAELGPRVSSPSVNDNQYCEYSCGTVNSYGDPEHWGLAHHFPTDKQDSKVQCYIAAAGWLDGTDVYRPSDKTVFIQGNSSDAGGLGTQLTARIEATASNLIMRHVYASNLKAEGDGGAVVVAGGGMLIVEYATFRGNAAGADGMGQYRGSLSSSSGGAIHVSNAREVSITHCSFEDNQAAGSGGALLLANIIGRVTISDTDFARNKASVGGGAVLLDLSDQAGFLEPVTFSNCYGADNNVGASSLSVLTADGKMTDVPQEALDIGTESRWGEIAFGAASPDGCLLSSMPLSGQEFELGAADGGCAGTTLAANNACSVQCPGVAAEQCAYGGEHQSMTCEDCGSGVVQLVRRGKCSGRVCDDDGIVSDCDHDGTCCALPNKRRECECKLEYSAGFSKNCSQDQCDFAFSEGNTLCPGGECIHSSDPAKEFHECRYNYLWRIIAIVVTVLASIAPLFSVVRGFRSALDTVQENEGIRLPRGQDAVGSFGFLGFLFGATGLVINTWQTVSLFQQQLYVLFVCNLVVQMITTLLTIYFGKIVQWAIEGEQLQGSQIQGLAMHSSARDWLSEHWMLRTVIMLLSASRLQSLAVLRLRPGCCGRGKFWIEMPMANKYWYLLRHSGGYLHLIADVPHIIIAVAMLSIQWYAHMHLAAVLTTCCERPSIDPLQTELTAVAAAAACLVSCVCVCVCVCVCFQGD